MLMLDVIVLVSAPGSDTLHGAVCPKGRLKRRGGKTGREGGGEAHRIESSTLVQNVPRYARLPSLPTIWHFNYKDNIKTCNFWLDGDDKPSELLKF